MDLMVMLQHAHWLQIMVTTIVVFALGALWYSPLLFINQWMKELSLTKEMIEEKQRCGEVSVLKIMGGSFMLFFLYTLAMDIFFSSFLSGYMGGAWAALITLLFVGTSTGINYLYEGKSLNLWFINVGYLVIGFGIAGLILSIWK